MRTVFSMNERKKKKSGIQPSNLANIILHATDQKKTFCIPSFHNSYLISDLKKKKKRSILKLFQFRCETFRVATLLRYHGLYFFFFFILLLLNLTPQGIVWLGITNLNGFSWKINYCYFNGKNCMGEKERKKMGGIKGDKQSAAIINGSKPENEQIY